MENKMQAFNFEGNETRVVVENGELWVVAKDVAETLGYSKASMDTMAKLLGAVPPEWRTRKPFPGGGRELEIWCLSEQGLYFFLGRSDMPKALPYQKWIAGEVVPAIRRHGVYITPDKIEEILTDPDSIIKIAQTLKEERAKRLALEIKRDELEAEVEAARPDVEFAEAVERSEGCILVREFAKMLCQKGIDIGEKRLYAILREKGFLITQRGRDWNMPTQKSAANKLFRIKETVDFDDYGNERLYRTTLVTGAGQRYFFNYFQNRPEIAHA